MDKQIVNHALGARLAIGMNVRTLDGARLGEVAAIHGDTFDVKKGFFFVRDYGAALDEILVLDEDGVVLNRTTAELRADRDQIGTSLADRAHGVVDHARDALDEVAAAVTDEHHG